MEWLSDLLPFSVRTKNNIGATMLFMSPAMLLAGVYVVAKLDSLLLLGVLMSLGFVWMFAAIELATTAS